MITAVEYLLEPFLTQFYLQEAICSDFLEEDERRRMFWDLATVFCIPHTEELEHYYNESSAEHFRQISDFPAYERFCRVIAFAEESGQSPALTQTDRMILAQKREAMRLKAELFRKEKNLTRDTIATGLINMALNGNVAAMATLAYMEYNGICLCGDIPHAIKRLRRCAKWNDLFGNLMGIVYDPEYAKAYYDRLYTIFRSASQKPVFARICDATQYTGACKIDPVAKIIEIAFGLNTIQRGQYDFGFSKVAHSMLISLEDKEKLLLNKQRDAIAALSDIPFGVKDQAIHFAADCTDTLPLRREEEVQKILQNLTVTLRCPAAVYKPLMIVSTDAYITEMYSQMLRNGFAASGVVEVDCSTLTAQDFVPSKENIFLRGLSESKNARTVFLLRHCEELEGDRLTELHKMLEYTYRRKFKLFTPPVSIDLSKLVFVLLSGEHNAATMALSKQCETVWAESVSTAEKHAVIDSLFAGCAESFGCADITLDKDGKAFLVAYDTEQIHRIVDGALRNAVFAEAEQVTLAALKNVCETQQLSAAKRGFGYIGGDYHA